MQASPWKSKKAFAAWQHDLSCNLKRDCTGHIYNQTQLHLCRMQNKWRGTNAEDSMRLSYCSSVRLSFWGLAKSSWWATPGTGTATLRWALPGLEKKKKSEKIIADLTSRVLKPALFSWKPAKSAGGETESSSSRTLTKHFAFAWDTLLGGGRQMQLLNRQLLLTGIHPPSYFHWQRRVDPSLDLQVTTRLTANQSTTLLSPSVTMDGPDADLINGSNGRVS